MYYIELFELYIELLFELKMNRKLHFVFVVVVSKVTPNKVESAHSGGTITSTCEIHAEDSLMPDVTHGWQDSEGQWVSLDTR